MGGEGVLLHTAVTRYGLVTRIFPVPVFTFMTRVLTPHDEGRIADYPSLASAETAFISR